MYNNTHVPGIISEDAMNHLPEIVKKYMAYTGFAGKERVRSFKSEFTGGIRSNPGEKFMKLSSVQYNFMGNPARIFYIVARKMGIPAKGLHIYRNAKASFKVKIFGLFTVVDAVGPKLDQGETVTLFNDMCFIAPGTLIDKRISWEEPENWIEADGAESGYKIGATFTNNGISIKADLFFKGNGQLIDFISNDRCETDGKVYNYYPWSTPVSEYREINGFRLPSKAQLIYLRPEGKFCYGEFELKNTEINI